jgi:hypothetical protein
MEGECCTTTDFTMVLSIKQENKVGHGARISQFTNAYDFVAGKPKEKRRCTAFKQWDERKWI